MAILRFCAQCALRAVLLIALACGLGYVFGRVARADAPMLAYVALDVRAARPSGQLRFYDPARHLRYAGPTGAPFDSEDGLAWSPDGRQLAVLGGDALSIYDPLTGALARLREMPPGSYAPRWSPDGRWLAYLQIAQRQQDIYTLRMDGQGDPLRGHAPRNISNYFINDNHHAWSPDGAWIAWHAQTTYGWDVYIGRPDGAEIRKVASRTLSSHALAWSPDSAWLAVMLHGRLRPALHALDLRAPDPLSLPLAGLEDHLLSSRPIWSPDGASVAFFDTSDGLTLRQTPAINLDAQGLVMAEEAAPPSTQVYRLDTPAVVRLHDAARSPDGGWHALLWAPANRIGLSVISVLRADGSAARSLESPGEWHTPPAWRP